MPRSAQDLAAGELGGPPWMGIYPQGHNQSMSRDASEPSRLGRGRSSEQVVGGSSELDVGELQKQECWAASAMAG
jgi:hypothetical protein